MAMKMDESRLRRCVSTKIRILPIYQSHTDIVMYRHFIVLTFKSWNWMICISKSGHYYRLLVRLRPSQNHTECVMIYKWNIFVRQFEIRPARRTVEMSTKSGCTSYATRHWTFFEKPAKSPHPSTIVGLRLSVIPLCAVYSPQWAHPSMVFHYFRLGVVKNAHRLNVTMSSCCHQFIFTFIIIMTDFNRSVPRTVSACKTRLLFYLNTYNMFVYWYND